MWDLQVISSSNHCLCVLVFCRYHNCYIGLPGTVKGCPAEDRLVLGMSLECLQPDSLVAGCLVAEFYLRSSVPYPGTLFGGCVVGTGLTGYTAVVGEPLVDWHWCWLPLEMP